MLRYRFFSAVIGIPIILAFLYLFKGNYFFILIFIIAIAGLIEYNRLFKTKEIKPLSSLLFLGGPIIILACNWFKSRGLLTSFLIAVAATLVVNYIINKETFLPVFIDTSLGLFYIPFLLSHLILLKNINPNWVLAVLIGTWVTDISAYSVGALIGKTKLAPAISPKKTLEGALTAIIICGLVFIFFTFLNNTFWWHRLLFGLIIGFFTVVGDLVESKIKRSFKIKDTGKLIPGHGGFLDRFDSLLLTGAAGLYLVLIFFN